MSTCFIELESDDNSILIENKDIDKNAYPDKEIIATNEIDKEIIDNSDNDVNINKIKDNDNDKNDLIEKDKIVEIQKDDEGSFIAYWDMSSKKYYYHNHTTNVTQWEAPAIFTYYDYNSSNIAPSSSSSTAITNIYQQNLSNSLNNGLGIYPITTTNNNNNTYYADYKSCATFNSKNSNFGSSGTTNYWDQVGRPDDKAGRQMSMFFDINQLENGAMKRKDISQKEAYSNYLKHQEKKKKVKK